MAQSTDRMEAHEGLRAWAALTGTLDDLVAGLVVVDQAIDAGFTAWDATEFGKAELLRLLKRKLPAQALRA